LCVGNRGGIVVLWHIRESCRRCRSTRSTEDTDRLQRVCRIWLINVHGFCCWFNQTRGLLLCRSTALLVLRVICDWTRIDLIFGGCRLRGRLDRRRLCCFLYNRRRLVRLLRLRLGFGEELADLAHSLEQGLVRLPERQPDQDAAGVIPKL
ncbi:hypothetical protein CI238_03318, partial [Colletotrichum incanum]